MLLMASEMFGRPTHVLIYPTNDSAVSADQHPREKGVVLAGTEDKLVVREEMMLALRSSRATGMRSALGRVSTPVSAKVHP